MTEGITREKKDKLLNELRLKRSVLKRGFNSNKKQKEAAKKRINEIEDELGRPKTDFAMREAFDKTICEGKEYLRLKKYKKALRIFDKAIKICPRNFLGLELKTDTLSRMRRFDEALDCNDIALSNAPLNLRAWMQRIEIFNNMYNHVEVISCCDKLLVAIQTKATENYSLLTGSIYKKMLTYKMSALSKLGKLEEAKILAKEAVKLFPVDHRVLANCAAIYESLEEFEMAVKLFDSAIQNRRFPDWRYYHNKGVNLYYLHKYAEARKSFKRATEVLKTSRDSERPWLMLGVTALKTDKDYYFAIECFDKALVVNPNYIRAYENKAYALEKLGYFNEAKLCYRLANEKSGRDITLV